MELRGDQYYKRLITKCLSGDSTESDCSELKRWIGFSEKNRQEFIESWKVWLLTSQATAPRGRFNRSKYRDWQEISRRFDLHNTPSNFAFVSFLRHPASIAALLLLFIAVGAVLAWLDTSAKFRQITSADSNYQVIVPFGGKSEVLLPDGTKVSLNAGSFFSYSADFGHKKRKVYLEGEGYFEVESNSEMPFIVAASDIEVHASGTVFNIKAYPNEEQVITTLIEGVVTIRGKNIDLTMLPDQRVTYIRGQHLKKDEKSEELKEAQKDESEKQIKEEAGITIGAPVLKLAENVDTYQITAWKEGVFIFNSEKLKNLAVILERKFDVKIDIESEELKNHVFTGTFHQETLEQILNVISISAPIKYRIDQGVVQIETDRRREALFRELS